MIFLLYFVAVVVEESVDNVTVCSTEFDDQLWAAMRCVGKFIFMKIVVAWSLNKI